MNGKEENGKILEQLSGNAKIASDTELRRLRRHLLYPRFKAAAALSMAAWFSVAKENNALVRGKYLPVPADFYLLFVSPITPRRN